MGAYIQMGHGSENLVGEEGLTGYSGIILSPVNRSEFQLSGDIPVFRSKGSFDIVLDPQLYSPRGDRGALTGQPYFPADFDTADPTSTSWIDTLVTRLAEYGKSLKVDAICSPTVIPNRWNSDYYSACSDCFEALAEKLDSDIKPLLTLCLNLSELSDPNHALSIASIVTRRAPSDCYIVVHSDTEPRRELTETSNLYSLMVLVGVLERSGCHVLMSHCSSEMILMKAAGASHCATGKFFNLRRFTKSRFEKQDESGGGQLPYWFEHSLLAFLRQADVARIRRAGLDRLIGSRSSMNLWGERIMLQFDSNSPDPWLGQSWRQYLAWFSNTEARIQGEAGMTVASKWMKEAEENWQVLQDKDVLLEEARNDGRWLRPWRQALGDFRRFEF